LSHSVKICPTCDTQNHINVALCSRCGTPLGQVRALVQPDNEQGDSTGYNFRFGETDLLESATYPSANRAFIVFFVGFIAFLGVVVLLINRVALDMPPLMDATAPAGTAFPTLSLSTVTLGPPTPTETFTPPPTPTPSTTPTRSPCTQRIGDGGSLIGAITACGYNNLDVMPTVMALNNITDAGQIRVGQEIIVPWPTETLDPNLIPTETPIPESGSSSSNEGENELLSLNLSIDPFAPTATATLPAGVMWHSVQPNENITVLALLYNANAKVLSELNPEVDFARCEFGERFGGPECLVQLSIGQQMRVPAPTPMPTLSPTPDPNATATPTATPTYNKPNIVSPSDKQFFGTNELVSLRWIPSATLREGEAYRVDIFDMTSGGNFTGLTTDIFFLVPSEWRGQVKDRHEYRWTVGIVLQTAAEQITFQTEPRTFVWQGLTEK